MDSSLLLTSRYRLKVIYDGTPFLGWQSQHEKGSLQDLLKEALQTCLRDPNIHPVASGRTDAGVHARAQIVHFDTHTSVNCEKLMRSLNGLLPVQFQVLALEPCSLDFHARYSAIGKIYHYHIHTAAIQNPFHRLYRWHIHYPLDNNLVKQACRALEGCHDFKALANENHKGVAAHDSIRTLHRVEPFFFDDSLRIEFEGDGFLYKMVRNCVGLIIEVGRGYRPLEDIEKILNSSHRPHAGYCAPAHGLFLYKVLYEPKWAPSKVLETHE